MKMPPRIDFPPTAILLMLVPPPPGGRVFLRLRIELP